MELRKFIHNETGKEVSESAFPSNMITEIRSAGAGWRWHDFDFYEWRTSTDPTGPVWYRYVYEHLKEASEDVWVVTVGQYSEMSIDCVFTTEQAAIEYVNARNANLRPFDSRYEWTRVDKNPMIPPHVPQPPEPEPEPDPMHEYKLPDRVVKAVEQLERENQELIESLDLRGI